MNPMRVRAHLPTVSRWRLAPPAHLRLHSRHRLALLRANSWVGVGLLIVAAVSAQASPSLTSAGSGEDSVLTAPQRKAVQAFANDLAEQALGAAPGATRAAAVVANPDARLRLAPCRQFQAHLPPGSPAVGRTRIGLRCTEGEAAWNIHVPVHIQLFGPTWVASRAVAAGSSATSVEFTRAQAEWSAERSEPVQDLATVQGRDLQRAMAAGETLRQHHLRARQWFNTGDTVKLVARGGGFQVVSSGQALNPGVEGQAARVRTENGRIVTGTATAERVVELPL